MVTSRVVSLVLLLTALAVWPRAQESRATAPAEPRAPTLAEAEARVRDVEKAVGLDDAQRTELAQVWRAVAEFARASLEQKRLTDGYESAVTDFEKRRKAVQDAILALPDRLPQLEIKDDTLQAAERALTQAREQLDAERAALGKLEAELQERSSHRARLPELQAAARKRAEEVDRAMARGTAHPGGSPLDAAHRSLLLSERQKLAGEQALYDAEERAFEPRGELLRLEIDRARRSVDLHTLRVALQTRTVEQRRKVEADRAAEEARKAKENQMQENPLLRGVADENARLAALRTGESGLPTRIERAKAELRFLQDAKAHYEAEFAKTREYVRVAARSDALGTLLVNRRGVLASDLDVRELERRALQRKADISDAQFKSLLFEEQRAGLAGAERELLVAGPSDEDRERWKRAVKEVVGKQQELLTALAKDYDAWFQVLVDLDAASHEVGMLVVAYERYIDERVLWTPSTAPLWAAEWEASATNLGRLCAPHTWGRLGRLAGSDVLENPFVYLLALVVLAVAWFLRRRALRRLPVLGTLAAQGSMVSFVPTLFAGWWTLAAACFWPLVIAIVGYVVWRQTWSWEEPDVRRIALATCSGLFATAGAFCAASVFRIACLEKGLGDAHFGWAPRATRVVRREFGWIMALGLPAIAVIGLLAGASEGRHADAFERACFLFTMALTAVFAHRTLRPVGGALDEYAARHAGSWFTRLRGLVWVLAVAAPFAFAVLTAIGWYHTASQLSARLQVSVWILYVAILGQALLLRWLTLARRRLAMEHLRRQLAAERLRNETGTSPAGEAAPLDASQDVDITAIGAQTLGLVRLLVGFAALLGLWFVWVDVLPALGVLEHVHLWNVTRQVMESGATALVTRTVPVTLADLLLALLIVGVTVTAVRNVPGLFQMALLNRVALQTGERYAITSVARYVITIVGIVIAFGRIGIGWEQVQWLAAAATLGLGFGLQEIFANFVSGLILLFERPIRVGDVVTIGDVEGRVTKIRMRATTILDGDRREMIVPNRDLVTGRVFNWTLTDPTSRVQVAVGVGYDSDVHLVEKLLLRCAHDNPQVLKDPAPDVVFAAFGDSALEFRLRVFIAQREDNSQVRSQLHEATLRALREAKIEIPFPQRDLHIKSFPPGITGLQGKA